MDHAKLLLDDVLEFVIRDKLDVITRGRFSLTSKQWNVKSIWSSLRALPPLIHGDYEFVNRQNEIVSTNTLVNQLREADFSSEMWLASHIAPILKRNQYLTSLTFGRLPPAAIEHLQHLTSLTSFKAVIVSIASPAYKKQAERLRDALTYHAGRITSLDISGSPRITGEELLVILEPLKALKVLKFRACSYIKGPEVKQIVAKYPLLEVLHLNDCDDWKILNGMSQLKEIAIDYTIQQQTEASVLSLLLDFPAHLLPILKIYGIRDPLLHNPVPLIHLAVGAGVRTEVEACQSMSSVLKLVEYISHDVDCMDGRGLTPLMLAVRTGNVELASFLLMLGANVLRRTTDGWTSFFYAIASGNPAMVDLLFSHDVLSKVSTAPGYTTEDPLVIPGGTSILHLAIRMPNSMDLLQAVFEAAERENLKLPFDHLDLNVSVVAAAIACGRIDIFTVLRDKGAPLPPKSSQSLFRSAVDSGKQDVLDYISKSNLGEPFEIGASSEFTITKVALQGDLKTLDLLLSVTPLEELNRTDHLGNNIILQLWKSSSLKVLRQDESNIREVTARLVEAGVDIDFQDNHAIELGVNLRLCDEGGMTALMYSVFDRKHMGKVCETILTTAFNEGHNVTKLVNMITPYGTILHLIEAPQSQHWSYNDMAEILRTLLQHGLDPTTTDPKGRTGLDVLQNGELRVRNHRSLFAEWL